MDLVKGGWTEEQAKETTLAIDGLMYAAKATIEKLEIDVDLHSEPTVQSAIKRLRNALKRCEE